MDQGEQVAADMDRRGRLERDVDGVAGAGIHRDLAHRPLHRDGGDEHVVRERGDANARGTPAASSSPRIRE